jgi:hypothetical protein
MTSYVVDIRKGYVVHEGTRESCAEYVEACVGY